MRLSVVLRRYGALVVSALVASSATAQIAPFETVTITPVFELNGEGTNVDSIAFWEAPDANETLMFVTGKGNDVVEVWKYPFEDNELDAIEFDANVNGVVVDQETDTLYVSDRVVSVFSLPDLKLQSEFGEGIIEAGENNLDILKATSGETWIYVSDDHTVHRFDAADPSESLDLFEPPVTSIETVLADDFYQMILVPEEQGPEGDGTGVFAYHPDGTPFEKDGTNRFGNDGEFDSDEEGIILYTFPLNGTTDNGKGFIVVSDQRMDVNEYEFFDRETWAHLGALRLEGVSNTDGIASTQRALPDYPLGVFAAIDDDGRTAIIGWQEVFAALEWDLAPEAVSILPVVEDPAVKGTMTFSVIFSESVTGFDDAADLTITHDGTANSGIEITGSGANYQVRLTGVSGAGAVTLAVGSEGGIQDVTDNSLAASVTSEPISVSSPYAIWGSSKGLTAGVNDSPSDDPDKDGHTNIVEFALAGNPLSQSDPIVSRVAINDVAGTQHLTLTFPVRAGAVFGGNAPLSANIDGVNYTVSGASDLANFDQPLMETVPAIVGDLPDLAEGWSYRTIRLAGSVPDFPIGFVRLLIGEIPL